MADQQLTAIETAIRDQSDDLRRVNNSSLPVRYLSASIIRPADTNVYAANDAFSNSTSAPFAGGFRFIDSPGIRPAPGMSDVVNGGFVLWDAIFVASGVTAYAGEIWLFDTVVTNINDNAAFTVSDTEALTVVGVIPFATTVVTAANAISFVSDINIRANCLPSDLRFLVKITNTPTPTSAEVLSMRIKYQPLRAV